MRLKSIESRYDGDYKIVAINSKGDVMEKDWYCVLSVIGGEFQKRTPPRPAREARAMGNYDWQTPSMDKANRSTIDARLKRLHTALPGRIVAFDAARQVASVQPMIEQQLMDGSRQALPLLPDVPVQFPGAAASC